MVQGCQYHQGKTPDPGIQGQVQTELFIHAVTGDIYLSHHMNYIPLADIGPVTRCDAAHLEWNVLKPLRCIKIACDALRCIYHHVGNLAPDFGISQLFLFRFSNGLHHCNDHLISFHMIYGQDLSVKYFWWTLYNIFDSIWNNLREGTSLSTSRRTWEHFIMGSWLATLLRFWERHLRWSVMVF